MIPELLAPAGSPEALLAAASAGADAVYFGGSAFSNRMRARNFDAGELTEALTQCRMWGIKTCVTVNTRVSDGEMNDALSLVDLLCEGGVSALIVADFGLAAEIHRRYPTLPLHASTQATCMTRADMEALAPLGFTRIVLPREISLEEVRLLTQSAPLETELFCHGAHCVSVSGQCLMSYVMGGRSGNRGECAQPCRMAYRCERLGEDTPANRLRLTERLTTTQKSPKERDPYLERYPEALEHPKKENNALRHPDRNRMGENRPERQRGVCRTDDNARKTESNGSVQRSGKSAYPLSLRDMCLAAWIPELISSGVTSLKLEGRQKPASYVYGVTRIYRTLLDEGRRATPEETAELDRLFSREGFTDAYFANATGKKRPYVSMCGVRPPLGAAHTEAATRYNTDIRRRTITGVFTGKTGEKATLCLSCGGITVAETGETVQSAATAPLSVDAVRKNITKTGGTAFVFTDGEPEILLSPDGFLPISAVNALRRAALEKLTEAVLPRAVYPRVSDDGAAERGTNESFTTRASVKRERYAVMTEATQCTSEAAAYFDRIFLPADVYLARRDALPAHCCADLPPVLFSDRALADMIDALAAVGCPGVRIHAPGQLHRAKAHGLWVCGSLRLNIWNNAAVRFWRTLGADALTASPEATLAMLRRMNGAAGTVVYGRLPLMRTERCFLADTVPGCGGHGGRRIGDALPGCGDGCAVHGCLGMLTDRMQMRFPVLARNGECEIENAAPLWMADRMDALPALTHEEYLFTIESPAEVDEIIRAYRTGKPGVGRRLK